MSKAIMTEQQEKLLVRLILKHCIKLEATKTIFDDSYIIKDVFELAKDVDSYYKNKK